MTSKFKQRISLSIYFFLSGFCFATWTSRIPTIKALYNLNEAQLGNLLLTMPISSLIGLPISGWLVSKYNSRSPLLVAFIFFSISLFYIGNSSSIILLIAAVSLFSFSMRIINIAMNTQSITLQKTFERKIIGSFHGIWSTGGLLGVLFTTIMIKYNVSINKHLLIVAVSSFLAALIAYNHLITNDRSASGNKLILGKPDKFILSLGIMVFLAAICEGAMFDWSGVYFKEVIHEEIFTVGYLMFMVFMAFSRFFSDVIIENIGMKKMYIISASLISLGIFTVVVLPYFWPALVGFSLVGVGVAAVIPMTFSLAGNSKKYSPGMAISIIATYGIVGMLLGPPIIGYLAHLFSLKFSFMLIILTGLLLIPISQNFFRYQEK